MYMLPVCVHALLDANYKKPVSTQETGFYSMIEYYILTAITAPA